MPQKSKPRPVGRVRSIPVARRMDVTRAEFNHVIEILNERGQIINDLRHNQDVQFRRLAQLQAELDLLRRAWDKSGRSGSERPSRSYAATGGDSRNGVVPSRSAR